MHKLKQEEEGRHARIEQKQQKTAELQARILRILCDISLWVGVP